MTREEIDIMWQQALQDSVRDGEMFTRYHFAKMIAAKEREALEVELLKLKQGVAANSDYIQGRWDLIGEFQDIIRLRG